VSTEINGGSTAPAQQGVVIVRRGKCQPEAKHQNNRKRNFVDKLKVSNE